jgi:hypothetical protein
MMVAEGAGRGKRREVAAAAPAIICATAGLAASGTSIRGGTPAL